MSAVSQGLNRRLLERFRATEGTGDTRGVAGPARPAAAGSWEALGWPTRLLVGTVAVFGAVAVTLSIPLLAERTSGLFTTLAILSLVTAFAKVNVLASGGTATFTVCYVIDFTAFLLLGTPSATLTAAAGVWTQCTFKCRERQHLHQTWFSIGALAATMQVTGLVYHLCGGAIGVPQLLANPAALAAAAAAYFMTNSLLVAAAVGMSSKQSIARLWWSAFAPMWRGYATGLAIAAVAAAGIARSTLCLVPLAFVVVALTHRNLKMFTNSLSESTTDALTGLPNRRFLASRVAEEIARAGRAATPLAIMVVDIDRFKGINDAYGHRAGDTALRAVTARLEGSLRAYDTCARYGGDEFVIVLPVCSRDDAEQKARLLEGRVREGACEVKPGVCVPLSVSIGAAVFPDDGATFDALFAIADRRMYDRKASRHATRAQPAMCVRAELVAVGI